MRKERRLLNDRHERFCQLFVFGHPEHNPKDPESPPDTQRNATMSYMHAGYKSTSYRGCAVNGCKLLKRTDIRARILELRDDEQQIAALYLRRWKAMLPHAQDVLERAMRGEEISAQAIQAAREVVEQSEGPTRFRFGIEKGATTDSGLSITLWSGRNRGD